MNFGQKANRIAPLGSARNYETYAIVAQPDTGIVSSCREAGCQAWANGWETTVDESTALGKNQASYIRRKSGRTFREMKTGPEDKQLTVFRFEPGQRCFAEHKTKRDLFLKRDGDFRGNPTGNGKVHANGRDWIEDLVEHEMKLTDIREKG